MEPNCISNYHIINDYMVRTDICHGTNENIDIEFSAHDALLG